MSRLVPYARSARPGMQADDAPGNAGPALKDRIEAISKYIPAEILAFYVPVVPTINLIKPDTHNLTLQWVVFVLAWVLVPVYFFWIAKGDQRLPRQIAISSAAFPIWAFVTNRELGPFGGIYQEAIALMLLMGFSLLTAFLLPRPPAD